MGTDIESPVHPDLPSQQLLEGINQQQRYPFEGAALVMTAPISRRHGCT